MKKVFNVIKWIVISVLVLFLILNITIVVKSKLNPKEIPSILGYKPFIVLSGSMESDIHVGDLVIVKEIEPSKLEVGDVIAFRDSEDLVTTHRIVEKVDKESDICFRTKGDANNTMDNDIVCSSMIEGKLKTKFNKIGNFVLFIQDGLGLAVVMLSILIVCILIYFFENRKIDKYDGFASLEEKKEFEEFKKMKNERKK